MQVVIALVQLMMPRWRVLLMMVAANGDATRHMLHVPLRLLSRLRVWDWVTAWVMMMLVPAMMLGRATTNTYNSLLPLRCLWNRRSSARMLFVFASCMLIMFLITFARAVARICWRLVILWLSCGLNMDSVGRILICLLVSLFLLLCYLRYVWHNLIWFFLHLGCQHIL